MAMLHRPFTAGVVVSLAILGFVNRDPAAAPVNYSLIIDEVLDLGALPWYSSSEAHAINDTGAIAGTSVNALGAGHRATFWPSPAASPVNMGHLGGAWSEAWGMNDAGTVVGNSRVSGSTASRGFRWTLNAGMTDLGLIGTVIGSGPVVWFSAADINNNGAIAGTFSNQTESNAPNTGGYLLAWGASLVPPCGDSHGSAVVSSTANAINDSGMLVGWTWCHGGGPTMEAYRGNPSGFITLPAGMSGSSEAFGIDASGRVVGQTSLRHAFRWSSSAGITDIHPPDDTEYTSVAHGINAHGLVVGIKMRKSDDWPLAFVYGQGIKMKVLPALCARGVARSTAYAVNDDGWIVGGSTTCSGAYHATLWKVRVVWSPGF